MAPREATGPLRLDVRADGFDAAFRTLLSAKREQAPDVRDVVSAILADVRSRGDAAVIDYTRRFDRVDLAQAGIRIPPEAVTEAADKAAAEVRDALALAADRIAAFHGRQRTEEPRVVDAAGVESGARWTPVDSVGLYVPGGKAAYPSSLLMNAIPAKVAGVGRIAMTVPTPDGALNPAVMAAARIAGIDEVYRVGGAQAVAALAFGTEAVGAVDKIVGPGNAYVTEAKRQVFGLVGIDSIAGPSEILVVADADNDPAWIAADLLSQAEHGDDSQCILITDDAGFADAVAAAADHHLETLPRADWAGASWRQYGAIIVVEDLQRQAAPLVDRIAPEHLELAVADPDAMADQVRHAGAIFLGRHTPEAVGDYVGGPNHVLPTSRSARFSSGLNTLDFMKRTTVLRCDPDSLGRVGPAAVTLAEAEGLTAHALSVALRLSG